MPPLIRPAVPSLERRLREFWAYFDAKDYEALLAMMTEDAIETDDLAQSWLRGHAAIGEHFARIGQRSEESHTLLEDVKVTETSPTAVVTCVVHYRMRWDGQPASVKAPTTMIFVRRECRESRCSTRSRWTSSRAFEAQPVEGGFRRSRRPTTWSIRGPVEPELIGSRGGQG